MNVRDDKIETIRELQKQILSLQGFKKPSAGQQPDIGLGPIEHAFPEHTFPLGTIHEFISPSGEEAAAANGFISGLLGKLMNKGGLCLWVSTQRRLFPPALNVFGIDPERIIFIDLPRRRDALWAMGEALKCEALTAVVGELGEVSFKESRKLQLAVESSRVTGLLHCYNPISRFTTASVSRWNIRPLPSVPEEGMPGLGFPRWQVELIKVRNGRPGTWQVEWSEDRFSQLPKEPDNLPVPLPSKTASYA